jgi:hypothetical protein
MGRRACTEPQCLYKGALIFFLFTFIYKTYEQSVIGVITTNVYPFCSLLWAYDIWFTPTSSGMQLGHKTRPGCCKMQHWRFSSDWSCMCVSWSLSYSTLFISEWLTAPTFRACTPLRQVPYVPECPLEELGNIGHLHEWGTISEVGAIICHVECITLSFLTFFPVWEEHSVNHGWLCSGEDVCQMCGHRPLLHQSTMGLAQEWTPPR